MYKQLPAELFKRYQADPLGTDDAVRKSMAVPEDRYYMVSTWPEDRAGRLTVNMKDFRKVVAKKISKSDQKT